MMCYYLNIHFQGQNVKHTPTHSSSSSRSSYFSPRVTCLRRQFLRSVCPVSPPFICWLSSLNLILRRGKWLYFIRGSLICIWKAFTSNLWRSTRLSWLNFFCFCGFPWSFQTHARTVNWIQATTASHQLFSNSLFTNRPVATHCMIPVSDGVFK